MDGESMMDIRYGNGEGRFTLRAAALIIRDGSVLLARDDAHDCFYTVGGGIRQNESSAEAARRECREETGCALEVERLLFVQERFYSLGNTPQHEVTFFYLMKDDAVPLRSGAATDQPGEHLHWLPVGALETVNVVPAFLRRGLRELPAGVTHIITRE